MNPLFFGNTAHALYGVHHPPRGDRSRATGVVLCYPFGQEYMRAHRAFRQLSLLLSGEGFHTFRFDYSGTGDSSGEPSDISLARWQHDLDAAADELIETAALDSVWIIGLRLGAVLALQASTRPNVAGVVLWDPVVQGQSQLAEAALEMGVDRGSALALGGVRIFDDFKKDLTAVNLLETPVRTGIPCLVAVSQDSSDNQQLRDRLARDGARVHYKCVPSDGRWSLQDNWGSALIPQALIRAIVDYVKETAR